MKKALTRENNSYFNKGDDIRGDLSGISGNLSCISGNLSNIYGDLDDCEISQEDRDEGIDIEDLVK